MRQRHGAVMGDGWVMKGWRDERRGGGGSG